ncbi:hypothetical protein RL73_00215 [Liberibacter crescens]|nr:hypothetical protein RL73_00215 [Liberibacter crescens]
MLFPFFSVFLLDSCQVKPLYYSNSSNAIIKSNSIEISAATNYVEQLVRNHLFFLFFHGKNNKEQTYQYKLIMNVTSNTTDVLLVNSSDKALSGRITLTAVYALQTISDGKIIHKGSLSTTSLVDFSEQAFAKIRAIRNAEERAAKELAESINIDIINVISNLK